MGQNTFLLMKEEMEKQKYEEIRASIEQNKELVHDTKNHYLVISEYVKNQEYEKLENYVDKIRRNFVKNQSTDLYRKSCSGSDSWAKANPGSTKRD